MTFAERVQEWNRWYDRLPREWRFQFVLWPLIIVGAINILLTVSSRFPFGLLLLLGILVVASVRVPYLLSHGRTSASGEMTSGATGRPGIQISGGAWLIDWNRRYDALPETRRLWVLPAVLVVAGTINMLLTIGSGFPFGLLFLLALLAVVAARAPYTAGWLSAPEPPNGAIADTSYQAAIDHAPTAAIVSAPAIASTSGDLAAAAAVVPELLPGTPIRSASTDSEIPSAHVDPSPPLAGPGDHYAPKPPAAAGGDESEEPL